jgi:hypothetical protein
VKRFLFGCFVLGAFGFFRSLEWLWTFFRRTAEPSIVCPVCQRRSFHPKDIEHRYCGFCRQFHEFMALPNALGSNAGDVPRV